MVGAIVGIVVVVTMGAGLARLRHDATISSMVIGGGGLADLNLIRQIEEGGAFGARDGCGHPTPAAFPLLPRPGADAYAAPLVCTAGRSDDARHVRGDCEMSVAAASPLTAAEIASGVAKVV